MNTNGLSPQKYTIAFDKFKSTAFFAQSFSIPQVSIGTSPKPTNDFVDYTVPGDKIIYDPLTITFLYDEDLTGYLQIFNWLNNAVKEDLTDDTFSDMSIILLTNNSNENKIITFKAAFPVSLSGGLFDTRTSEDSVLTYDVTFNYAYFEVK